MSFARLKTSVKRLQLTDGLAEWDDISGKPDAFPPEAHTHVAADITDLASNTFETVSKNLAASNYTFTFVDGDLVSLTYANGITKTLNYSGEGLASVTLSGATPGGIELTKTLTYSGGDPVSATYS